MKSIVLAAVSAVALLASAPAMAADLPVMEAPAVVAVPSFSWTGAYVGVTAGYVWDNDHKVRTRGTDAATRANVANRLRPPSIGIDGDGFLVGGTVGYNVQLDGSPLVFGIEADLSYTDIDDRSTFNTPPLVGAGNIRSTFKQELDYLGTVRGRVGYAFDRVLVFGTGGLAFGKVKTSARFFNNTAAAANPGALAFTDSESKTEYGYAVGGGVEYAVTDNITIKGEYLYYDLGTTTLDVRRTAVAPAGQAGYKSKFDTDGHIARVGLNYKF